MNWRLHTILLFTILQYFVVIEAHAAAYKRGVLTNPCSQPVPKGHQLNLDFGQLCYYETANAKLSRSSHKRVVYFGDSITRGWGARLPGLPGGETINRGIGGQTTAQMLVRFRADVINLKPRIVHIMAGTNDLAGNTGATSLKRIKDAIQSMAEQASAKRIQVVLGSVLPVKSFYWRPEVKPAEAIIEINNWLHSYAKSKGYIFVDYYSALHDGRGGFLEHLTTDGVHPNAAGYDKMTSLAADVITKSKTTL